MLFSQSHLNYKIINQIQSLRQRFWIENESILFPRLTSRCRAPAKQLTFKTFVFDILYSVFELLLAISSTLITSVFCLFTLARLLFLSLRIENMESGESKCQWNLLNQMIAYMYMHKVRQLSFVKRILSYNHHNFDAVYHWINNKEWILNWLQNETSSLCVIKSVHSLFEHKKKVEKRKCFESFFFVFIFLYRELCTISTQ